MKINGTKTPCPTCGNPVPESTGAGRPPVYCSDNCRDIEKFRVALAKRITQATFDDKHRALIRGELFRMANSI